MRATLIRPHPPMECMSWRVLGRGKQDVLLAVVPSTPLLIAITCTTRMALFSLDGTRLPVVASGTRSAGDASPRGTQDGDDTSAEVESRGGWIGGARFFPVSQRARSSRSSRSSSSAFGASVGSDDRGDGDDDELSQSSDFAAEVHQRDIRCLVASPAGDMIATG